VVLALGVAACVRDPTVACGELACPAGSVCIAGGCATPEAIEACAGVTEGAPCTAPTVTNGSCVGQVCVSVVCGDGAVVADEVCDDGNDRSGDGCSADCRSRETCGNRYVDTLAGEECDDGDRAAGDGCTSTWEWDGTRWWQVTTTGPAPRQQGILVYDNVRRETVLFGGDGPDGPISDTWVWDGTTWSERSPVTSPSARVGHAAAFDAERGRVVLCGGQTDARVLADSWEWDGTTWRALAVATGPGPRVKHGLAYDPIRHQVIGYGGGQGTPSSLRLQTVARRFSSQVNGPDACHDLDTDGDSLVGCGDPDCWARCTPHCPPGGPCDPAAPRCGDGTCNPRLEHHRLCPADCAP
jgi:cysteine-rich repeat protein